ncbi:Hypothetical predicted protein [Pelobates cultripes]|uniref:Uncharacterized protein n=1 Tax=Pelobates cultripes TaxID=61616 RepID=A0AAD1VJB6_PELCU|nr:Hypothetical predicted protein [Pelobates cultripes]
MSMMNQARGIRRQKHGEDRQQPNIFSIKYFIDDPGPFVGLGWPGAKEQFGSTPTTCLDLCNGIKPNRNRLMERFLGHIQNTFSNTNRSNLQKLHFGTNSIRSYIATFG